jgi:hypothetical protein
MAAEIPKVFGIRFESEDLSPVSYAPTGQKNRITTMSSHVPNDHSGENQVTQDLASNGFVATLNES